MVAAAKIPEYVFMVRSNGSWLLDVVAGRWLRLIATQQVPLGAFEASVGIQ
jgi:hypothetical protein